MRVFLEDEVRKYLDLEKWKNVHEIQEEMRQKWSKQSVTNFFIQRVLPRLNAETAERLTDPRRLDVYDALFSLQKKGLVELQDEPEGKIDERLKWRLAKV